MPQVVDRTSVQTGVARASGRIDEDQVIALDIDDGGVDFDPPENTQS